KTLVVIALAFCTGCPNSFSEFANKNTDEAFLFQAQLYADSRDWDNAILSISRMSAGGRADRATKYALSSYYAGRCGLDLLDFADALSGLSSTKLLPLLLTEFKGNLAADLADCQLAEDTIFSISTTYASLTADENILLALLEFVKIGSVLSSNANVDADDDGTYDGDYWTSATTVDICSEARTDVTDLEVGKVGTGVMIAYNALTASGSDIAADLGSVGGICTALGGCSVQDPTAFSAGQLLILRALFKSNEIGFNTCGATLGTDAGGRTSDCICPTTP
ncbi:MAG: hypothetical protein AAB250_03905, partial [Bdellovibrionota bacterium]